jgi:hypothetical protein
VTKFFYAEEIRRPEDVIAHLAEGERHWRKGKSAYELATSWIRSGEIPAPVQAVLDTCPDYRDAELIQGLFEREVDLGTPGRRSQTDLMALIKLDHGYAILAVEGKVEEPFGPLVGEWRDGSPGRERRLAALCATLGLNSAEAAPLRYQLLHRSASAVYEARRYGCDRALMLVHSFSATRASLPDFVAFAIAIGTPVDALGKISGEKLCDGVGLRLAWVADLPCA